VGEVLRNKNRGKEMRKKHHFFHFPARVEGPVLDGSVFEEIGANTLQQQYWRREKGERSRESRYYRP
jgi:hypothetical protein